MRKFRLVAAVGVFALVAAACAGGGDGGGDGGSPAAGGNDLLAAIRDEGVITVSTDPNYAPQSFLNDAGEYEGFDIDVATEIANRLGVDVAWEAPRWNQIISGNWSGRWDMSVGSMTVTPERAEVLHFTPAYYFTPAGVAVHEDNTTINDVTTDLDGKRVGVCGGCTYEFYLDGSLSLPNEQFEFVVDDPQIQTYDTDQLAIDDLGLGDGVRLDAVVSAAPTLEGAAEKGKPIKVLAEPLFYEPLGVAIDRSSELDPTSLVEEVSAIVEEMHSDGTLTSLSEKWYDGEDLTVRA